MGRSPQHSSTKENIEISETEYEVEQIIGKRQRKGTIEYLVKWSTPEVAPGSCPANVVSRSSPYLHTNK